MYNNKKIKIFALVIAIVLVIFNCNFVEARQAVGTQVGSGSTSSSQTTLNSDNSGEKRNWWGDAWKFFNGADAETSGAIGELTDLVKFVGNMIFVAVTVILGVKYIWGGIDSKASVKDSLVTLVVAALFFYGYSTISSLFISGNKLSFIAGGGYENTAKNIYSIIMYICNFLAVGGLVYIGIKYMMAGAEGKASLKARGVPIVLGIVMVYATITFLNFIVGIL